MRTRGRWSSLEKSPQGDEQAGQRRYSIPFEFKLHKLHRLSGAQHYHINIYHNHLTLRHFFSQTTIKKYFISPIFAFLDAKESKIFSQVTPIQKVMMVVKFVLVIVLMCKSIFYVEQFLSNVILINLKEGMSERFKGQTGSQSQGDRALQSELYQLITFVRRAPASIQRQLLPYCADLKKDFPNDQRLNLFHQAFFAETENRPEATQYSEGLIRNLFRILQLKVLPGQLAKTIERVQAERVKPQARPKQQIFGKGLTFDRVEMLHPEYDTYYKMSKQERQHHLPQYHPKNKFKEFYADPRYLVRIEELSHFRSNQKLKGDVLFLHYEGSIITGSKAYAVVRDRSIEHWQMASNSYPTPTLNIPAQPEQGDKKDEEEKKEKEPKSDIPAGTKFSLSHVLTGHQQKITSISFSQDQLYLISGSADRTVKLWCLRMRTCLCTYRGHQKAIWDVHFSPSGYYLLSGSADGCMILWKTDEPHAQRVYYHKGDVHKVSFARDPTFVISAGEDCSIKIWKALEAQCIRELKLGRPVINLSLGFSGALLVAVESDGRINIFDLLKGETINSFYFYEDRKRKDGGAEIAKLRVHDVCLSEDERELSCVTSKYVVIYSMERLEMKVNNNIYTFFETAADNSKVTRLPPKEIIYMGIETNLTYCAYQHKNVLVVAGSSST